jgi:hypothetical protein
MRARSSLSLPLSLITNSCRHHYCYRRTIVTVNRHSPHRQTHTQYSKQRGPKPVANSPSPTSTHHLRAQYIPNQHPSIPTSSPQPQQCASSPPPAKTVTTCAEKTGTTRPVQSQTSTAAPTTTTTTPVRRGLTRARRRISGAACRGAVACMRSSPGAVGGKLITCGPVALM